jgi:hypothetical protein
MGIIQNLKLIQLISGEYIEDGRPKTEDRRPKIRYKLNYLYIFTYETHMFEKHKHICIIIRYMWVPPLKQGRLS